MNKQEKIGGGIGKIIKKWYAPDSPHSEDGYGESCEHEIMVYLHEQGAVIKGVSLGVSHPHLANYYSFEPLIKDWE